MAHIQQTNMHKRLGTWENLFWLFGGVEVGLAPKNRNHFQRWFSLHGELVRSLQRTVVDNPIENKSSLFQHAHPQLSQQFSMNHEGVGHVQEGEFIPFDTAILMVFVRD